MSELLLREKAESIINDYCTYHAIGAITVGAFGGQFGADRLVLTYLTRKMILKICDLYGIKDKKARTIHVTAAIARLTITGTAVAQTLLNYIPGGPIVNGTTTYFLTRSAGLKCISQIEKGKMTVKDQLKIGLKDVTIAIVKNELSDLPIMDNSSMEDIVDNSLAIQDQLQSGGIYVVDQLTDYLNSLPSISVDGVNPVVYNALKTSFILALQSDFKIKDFNWQKLLQNVILQTLITGIEEYKGLTEDELLFRLNIKDEDFSNKLTGFINSSCEEFDKIEKRENVLIALNEVTHFIKEFFKIKDELTSERLYKEVFNNNYDIEIEKTYRFFFKNIENEYCDRNVWLRCAYCYGNLSRINRKYDKPGCNYNPLDDNLIYYIAGQVRFIVKILNNRTQDDIAFCISEFILKNNDILCVY